MPQGTLKIHTENILPIIKKWLYSDKDIFLRELVSNACDALRKVKVLREREILSHSSDALQIDILLDEAAKTIQIIDTGIGMTAEEVEKYIAQVAFSGAEEFINKYKTDQEQDQIIGHFGLGFYSAYMVAASVTIETLSHEPNAEPVIWTCDGSSEYQIDRGTRNTHGTTITLAIDQESEEYLNEARLRQILQQYCAFLPFPISLNGKRINDKDPLWLKPSSECTDRDYLDFYRALYPQDADPVFWIHLNVDYPFHLKGILYFPKIGRRFDWSQTNIKLFCNRVFVSDNCKDLIPDFLTVLRGAIDSPDIPLNVSRSTLQLDYTVRQLSSHISKKITDRLSSLFVTEKEKFESFWLDIETVVKLGCLQDDKFYDRAKDFLIWKNIEGKWTTLADYSTRNSEKIFYTTDDNHNAPFLQLYLQKNIEVLIANPYLDSHLMSLLESKQTDLKFQRIDGAIDTSLIDGAKEKTLLDTDGKTEAVKISDFVRSALTTPEITVEAKSLASTTLPGFILLDEHQRRLRDSMAHSQNPLPPGLMNKRTFIVNTNSPLISTAYRLRDTHPDLAKQLISHVYELSLLSQKELEPQALPDFLSRSLHILENLSSQIQSHTTSIEEK